MAVVGRIKVEGMQGLSRKLKDLEDKVAKQYLKQALKDAAAPVLAAAVANVPIVSGTYRSALKVKTGTSRRIGGMFATIGSKEGDYKGDAFYGSFLEYGHRLGSRKLGEKRKKVEPRPYLKRAYDQTKDQAVAVFASTLKRLIEGGVK